MGVLDDRGPRPYAETVLDAFGAGRVMWGSDWPVCKLAATYSEVIAVAHELTAGLGPAERHDLFTGTAVRTYGLAVTAGPALPQEPPCA